MPNPLARSLGDSRFGLLLNFANLVQVVLCYVSLGRMAAYFLAFLLSIAMAMAGLAQYRQSGTLPMAIEASRPGIEAIQDSPLGPFLGEGLEGEAGLGFVLQLQIQAYFQPAVGAVTIFSILAISFFYFKFLRSQTRARSRPFSANDAAATEAIEKQLGLLRDELPRGVALQLGTRTACQASVTGRRRIFVSLHDFVAMRENLSIVRFKVRHELYHLLSFDSLFASLARPIAALSALTTSILAGILVFFAVGFFLSGWLHLLTGIGFCWLCGRAIYRFFIRSQQRFLGLKELLADRFAAAHGGRLEEVLSYFDRPEAAAAADEDHPPAEERRNYLGKGIAAASPARLSASLMTTSFLFYFFPRWLGINKIDSAVPGLALWAALLLLLGAAESMKPGGGERTALRTSFLFFLLYLLLTLGLPLIGLWLQLFSIDSYLSIVRRRLEPDLALFFATPWLCAIWRRYLLR